MKNLIVIVLLFLSYNSFSQESLTPSEDQALLTVTVSDMENVPRPDDKIIFEGKHTHKNFEAIADKDGKFQILLPEGDIYLIKIQGLASDIDFDELRIPKQEGIVQGALAVKYRPERKFTLDDVHFQTAKSILLSSSFPTLDDLVEILKLKDDLRLEIAGHTDSVGDDDSNQELSQARAQSVVNYLTKKGIDKSRLIAQGYGENQPIADNTTDEGRQENRRTEARIL